MSNREQFEAFLISEYDWAEGALNTAIFCGDDATGHYVCGEHIYDKRDCSECLFWAWRGWQAASKVSEQQLAAVVAENAGLKQTESSLVRNIINDLIDTEFQYTRVQTPATDAYLAEVRASGVELFASSLKVLGPHEHPYSTAAKDFAAQLRQGAAPEALKRLRSIVADHKTLPRRKEWISGQQYSYVLLESVEAMVDDSCRAAMLQGADGNSPVVMDGWVMVPVEPTDEMLHALYHCGTRLIRPFETQLYQDMLTAAPQQEVK